MRRSWRRRRAACSGCLGTRLWFLQGTQQAAYQAKVTAAKTRVVYVPPERGRIFDAKGRILADNRQC